MLGKRRSEAGSSIPIDHLPHGGRDGRLGEACEVRVETGACTHARVGLVVALAIVDDAPVRRLARGACTMQLSVSSMRPNRRRCGGRHVDEHMCLVDMASTGGSRPNRIPLGTSPRCICEAESRPRHHAWGRLSGCKRHGRPVEASDRRPRPSRDVLPATDLSGSSRAFRGCLGGLWTPTDGRTAASDVAAASESPSDGLHTY